MNNTANKTIELRNLSICPITPDPPEILELIKDLKQHVKNINFQNDSIYKAYFTFDYDGVSYRLDDSVLSTSPAALYKAEQHIKDKLHELGASNVQFHGRCD